MWFTVRWTALGCPLGVSLCRSVLRGSLTPTDRWLVQSFVLLSSLGEVLGTAPRRTQFPNLRLICSAWVTCITLVTAMLGDWTTFDDRNSFLTQPC